MCLRREGITTAWKIYRILSFRAKALTLLASLLHMCSVFNLLQNLYSSFISKKMITLIKKYKNHVLYFYYKLQYKMLQKIIQYRIQKPGFTFLICWTMKLLALCAPFAERDCFKPVENNVFMFNKI